MKKIQLRVLTPLFTLFLLSISDSCVAAVTQAKIINIEGAVSSQVNPSADWTTAESGTILSQGAVIQTGDNSSCDLLLDQSVVRFKPGTKATLTSFDPVKIDLHTGKLFTLVKGLNQGSTFSVGTPTAVASARGTAWSQASDSIEAFQDVVHVENAQGETMDLAEGQGVSLEEDGDFGQTYEVPEESKSEFNDFSSDAAKGSDSPPAEAATAEDTSSAPPAATEETAPEETGDMTEPTEPEEPADTMEDLADSNDNFDDMGFDSMSDPAMAHEDTIDVMTDAQEQSEESSNDQKALDEDFKGEENIDNTGDYIV